jgi:hypothetical protein
VPGGGMGAHGGPGVATKAERKARGILHRSGSSSSSSSSVSTPVLTCISCARMYQYFFVRTININDYCL